MDSLPRSLRKTIEFFEKFPSIGPKTAKRLAFFLLKIPQDDLEGFADTLRNLKRTSLLCKTCFNLSEEDICSICADEKRNKSTIAVVEDVLDLLSFEMGNKYKGVYHVLHGKIDPLNYVGPDDIRVGELIMRVEKMGDALSEIILATNPTLEGEATAMYIKNKLKSLPRWEANFPSPESRSQNAKLKITRLAYGLPIGADLEYADYMTIERALEGRREY
ncbi:MAG TPA: recombination mediator RecR [Patescibacteria group bacterium]|nr:recombination mediator RecR [Patescibacteria group bacterium]